MAQVLLNVKSIEYIEINALANITLVHGRGVLLNDCRDFVPLEIVGLAKCEVASKIENKSKIFVTTLSALLPCHFDARDCYLAYLITCVNGERFLIGSANRPFPISNTSDSLPGSVTEPSGCYLTIDYTDNLGLMTVLD